MPTYRIKAPNGQTYRIEGPPGASDAEVADAVLAQYPEAGQTPSGPKESTIGSELVRGGKQLVSSARTGIGSIFNPEEAAKAGVARSEAIGQEAGVGPSLEAVQKAYQDKGVLSAAGEVVSQIPRALAGQGANLASMYAAGKAGAAAGAPFGARGRIVGGAAGAAGALLPQFMGSNVERQAAEQMEEGKDVSIDRTKAYTAAAGQAALESVGTAFTLGKRVVKGILGVADDAALLTAKSQAELVKAAERSLAASAGRGVVRGAAEMPVEVGQQILERYQAGLDLTSPEALKEYGESAYQAALIGGPLGGAAGAVERGQARGQVEQQKRAEEAARPAPPPPEEIVPGAKLPEEAPPSTQGTLFTPKEMGKKVPAPAQEAAPVAETFPDLTARREQLRAQEQTPEVRAELDDIAKRLASQSEEQLGLGLDFQREYTDLFKERNRLREGPQTPEVKARIAELSEQLASYDEADIGRRQAEKAIREERLAKEAKQKAADEAAAQRFPGLAGATTAPITQADIDAIGLPLKTSAKWIQDNVLGKTIEEIKALVRRDPKLISGTGARAGVLKALISPQPAAFEEKKNVPTTTKTNQPQGELDLGGGEPSVGVPSKPTGTDVVQPGTGVPATTGTSKTPDGLGLAPAGQPAGTGTNAQGTQPTAIKPQNAGYHAGDLGYGRDTTLGKMGGRSTGHFGTGVYFVGNPSNIPEIARGDRPVRIVDLSKYNLAKPRIESNARDLHEGLKEVNRLVSQEPDSDQYKTGLDAAVRNLDMSMVTKASRQDIRNIIERAVAQAKTELTDDVMFESTYIDSASTRVMKALGFEGIDVRGIPGYDNTTYGTVVYAFSLKEPSTKNAPATTPPATTTTTKKSKKATGTTETVETDAQRKAREDAERKAKEDAEAKARKEAEAKAEADRKAREEAEAEAERKREADEFKRQMEEVERKEKEARAKADAAKNAAATPPKPMAPSWAKSAAIKNKGVVVHSQGDIALIKYVDPDGKIIYGAVRNTSPYVSGDISVMDPITTKRFSSQEIAALQKAKREDVKREEDLAQKYPDGPFTNAKSNVVAGDNINPRYVGYLRDLMDSLGLKDINTFFFTGKDVENFPERFHLHGRYARPYEMLASGNETKGATTRIGPNNKDFFLYIRDDMDPDLTIEIIAHELGHMIQHIAFDTASAKEKQAVLDEYDAWLATNKGKNMRELVPNLRNRRGTELMEKSGIPDVTTDQLKAKQQQYWLGFSEWFADNVSRWATTADKPLTIAEKFFSRVAQMMRDLVAVVSGRKFPPSRAVANFLEDMGPGSADAWIQSRTPGGAPSVRPFETIDENPAFKKWFGDSKVVDKDGKPLVVYHGTLANFNTFKLSPEGALGAGIYTTPSAEFAGTYADTSNLSRPDAPKDEINGQKIMPVYVSMQNPLILDNERGDPMVAALVKLGVSQDKAEKIVEKAYDENGYVGKQVMTRAIAQGYDGIMQYKRGELSEIVAFKPTQIKSATGNRGTFSETDPKIDFAVTFSSEQLIDSMGPLSVPEKSGLKNLITGVQSNPDIGYVTKFRTQVSDIAATIEKRLSEKFDGAVRDKLGNLNPMGLYRQAQDYTKMLLEYFQTGTLYKDKTTGLWKSGIGEGVRPPAEVYGLIDKYADKNGYSRERATQIASRVLEGVRLNEMRRSNAQDGTTFLIHLKDNEIDQLVKEFNADPDLQEMSKLMDEARKAMVDNLVAVGRLSAVEGKLWREVVGYVPFDRETIDSVATNFNKAKKISGKGLAQLGKLPELVGSLNRPVGNVFDNYLNTLGWMVGQTLKADATLTTLRSLEDIGQAKFLGRTNQGKPNVVGAYVNGEMMYWSVPSKYDVMAFKDLNPPKAGWIRAMGAFSNILRKTVTVLPPFALKQVMDDVQRAIMTSGVRNPGALVWMSLTNFPKLVLAELRGIQHPMVKDFGKLGLTGEYDFEAGKPATSLLKDLGYKKRGVVESLIHKLDGITRASDLAVRKAIYDQTMKESKDDELLAQTRAREFINFRRRGANQFVTDMVTVIPFFNAYIQGMDVLYRAASGKDSSASVDRAQARQLFYSRAITVTMLSSLYALGKGDDDEDYNEMDLRTRDSNWILGGGYKIGVPGELGAIFKVIPERIVEYMRRQGTPEEQTAFEAVRTTLSYMFEQYLGRAVPIPQAIKPVIEAWANKSFLTGKDLEGYHHRAMDPSMRVTEQTSELAKAIAKFSRDEIGVEVSPIMIDNALRGYFGSTAAMVTMVTDSLLNPTRVDRPLHKYALLSNYLYDPVGTRRMTEFYEERELVGKANTTLRELMKTDLARAEKYADEHADELTLEGMVNSTLEQLERTRAYRKYLNSVEGANDMSKEDREAELKEIKQMELGYVNWVREAKNELRQMQR